MRKHTELVRKFLSEVSGIGGVATINEYNVLEVWVSNISDEKYDDVLFNAGLILYEVPGGHTWGNDGVGYLANRRQNFVEIHKTVSKSFAAEIRKHKADCLCIAG
jgi:hypothetical protein